MPLPGCLLACCESLLPFPLPCGSCGLLACSPLCPSSESPGLGLFCCWPFLPSCLPAFCCPLPCGLFGSESPGLGLFCCWPFLPSCLPAFCCPLPCGLFGSEFCCWLLGLDCGGLTLESRFWNRSFTLFIRLPLSPLLPCSCLPAEDCLESCLLFPCWPAFSPPWGSLPCSACAS